MEASEIRRRIVLVEQNAFRACQACAGGVGHDPNVGIICARDPKVENCGLLAVNTLRAAENPEPLLEQMTESWAMSFVQPKAATAKEPVAVAPAAAKADRLDKSTAERAVEENTN